MKNAWKAGAFLALSAFSPLVSGCGGGGGLAYNAGQGASNTVSGVSRGALAMQINFPSGKSAHNANNLSVKAGRSGLTRIPGFSNGNIPDGTQAVKVEVVTTTSPETSLGVPQIITSASAQTGGNVTGPVTVQFSNLPVGKVRLRASAYPDIAAKLNAIAIGTSDVVITANATANTNVSLALTIDHIALTPATVTLGFLSTDNTQTVQATPMTQDNRPLQMPLLITTDRPDVVSVSISKTRPPNTPVETVIGLLQTVSPTFATLPATATITFAEPNSGKTATAIATVIFDGD